MILDYVLIMAITFITTIIANYIRYKGSERFNKWVLVLASLIVIELYGSLFNYLHFEWTLLLFIAVTVVCFGLIGVIVSSFLASMLLVFHLNESATLEFVIFMVFAISVLFLANFGQKIRHESDRRLSILINNSKQLNVLREVSLSMQKTLHLEKLLQTILTSVTAGHGLGFNRAMILLMDDDGTKLRGKMGTGPMTAEEGFANWEEISQKKYKLMDLIQIKETEETTDQQLNDRVKRLEISLEESSFLSKALESGFPLHIKEFHSNDKTLMAFVQQFNMSEMAVIPLMIQGSKVGVLIIDNPVNNKPITASEIDSVIPLANQVAIAINHTHLYNKIEDMAHKDGLTGLLNQRAFQNKIEEYCLLEGSNRLSIIIIDIDSFKHYNDTNGHLLGNEVLIQLAEVIKSTVTEEQLAFRFGGEEFVVLLPTTAIEQATQVAEKLRKNVEDSDFPFGERQPQGRLTVSVGVASREVQDSIEVQGLFDAADKALYEAKENGKNKVIIEQEVLLS